MEPRLISTKEAAHYCGVSVAYLQSNYPGRYIRIGSYPKWDRKVLDQWIDEMSGLGNNNTSLKDTVQDYGWAEPG